MVRGLIRLLLFIVLQTPSAVALFILPCQFMLPRRAERESHTRSKWMGTFGPCRSSVGLPPAGLFLRIGKFKALLDGRAEYAVCDVGERLMRVFNFHNRPECSTARQVMLGRVHGVQADVADRCTRGRHRPVVEARQRFMLRMQELYRWDRGAYVRCMWCAPVAAAVQLRRRVSAASCSQRTCR